MAEINFYSFKNLSQQNVLTSKELSPFSMVVVLLENNMRE